MICGISSRKNNLRRACFGFEIGEHIMASTHPRMTREKKTVEAMINIYCKKHHCGKNKLCRECQELDPLL
jgi:hypothetical protein